MKMTRWWFSIVVWACASCSDRAVVGTDGGSPETTTDRGSYLGLKAPTSGAVVFAPGLVSRPGRYEYAMSIHPAGDRLLVTVEDPKEGASVHESRIRNGAWTTPQPVDLTGGDWSNEMEAFFSADGERVFFAPFCKGMDVRIWSADVTPTGFANPRPLGGPIARDPSFFPVQVEDGTLYYTNLAHRAVYRATLDNDEVTMVEPAGLELGGHAYPAPDGSFIVLDSASLDSEDQRDIFVAFRNDDGSWTTPRPLGPSVNTEHSETCPSLSPDGKFLFFSRYNEPGDLSNIYWVSSDVINVVSPA